MAWPSITIHRQLDSFATVQADGAPFDSSRLEFRETFRPMTFRPLEVFVDDERIFAGRLVGVVPDAEAKSATVSVSGYAHPGMLADNMEPEDSLPLEFKGLGLRAIATTLAEPFEIVVRFNDDAGAKFAKVKLEVDQKPYDFLADLARQRNGVLTSDSDGALVFLRSIGVGDPVGRLRLGEHPVLRVTPAFGPQGYHSHITGYAKHKRGRRGGRYTVRNPYLTDVLRPMAFKLSDTDPADVPTAAVAKLGRMFGNAATYTVELATWRDPKGRLWKPNTTVLLTAPDAMVYRETELLVRAVTLFEDATAKRATLQLVLPGAFTGEIPEVLPWAE